ncbi:MGH1-like glycoside hydrolase domain-containing protein [Paenibacillus aestuarii]|uniref:Mannosylglycerate hydrolase MGH1-like glycoside hydrolase domain-containing protein n=1 Tax=Paenibacillus aestuarii TaxID=516965 RepID=A0ABW0K458_9BACL|nr:hypothetical protein [Paenibacillus aestuarii]
MNESSVLNRLRGIELEHSIGELKKPSDSVVLDEWKRSGVKFATSGGDKLESVYYTAIGKLLDCIVPTLGEAPILHEGGIYLGCWMESTGTINAELLTRFLPSVSETTYSKFAEYQREDGQLPYKITAGGAAYRQIQMVTPLARCVWHHYKLHGGTRDFLRTMYEAMVRHDAWLAAYRNTRGTNCVEAFGTFDTGHDLSPRFWHVPDTPHLNDSRLCYPDSPILPFLAPDLTANVFCQRTYLALMAEELGENGDVWRAKAEESLHSLFAHCFDEQDRFFYDVDRNDEFVRVQSDVLLRVLACEVGDQAFFDESLRSYLLNTRKFFAKYPFTSIAMDDPRFDPSSSYNSWAGPSNFLSIIRAPHAFEHHDRYVELTWVMQPILSAMANMTRFGQTLSPWTGKEGFTEAYSPALLCLIDDVERLCGIMPRLDGRLWFTGLLPYAMDHGEELAEATAYSRTVDGIRYELVNTREASTIYRNEVEHLVWPHGVRVVTDREGRLQALIGMTVRTVEGIVHYEGQELSIRIKGNEHLAYRNGTFQSVKDIGVIAPTYE